MKVMLMGVGLSVKPLGTKYVECPVKADVGGFAETGLAHGIT